MVTPRKKPFKGKFVQGKGHPEPVEGSNAASIECCGNASIFAAATIVINWYATSGLHYSLRLLKG